MSARPVGVTAVGSVHMDLVATAAHVPTPGETLLGEHFAQHPGGKAANQAAAAALQGVPVTIV
ncbi:MAG: ribokinase, partial [Thermomicrobiales bacterium]|nr:ribokinase [Thermomicrobiales bacterium]